MGKLRAGLRFRRETDEFASTSGHAAAMRVAVMIGAMRERAGLTCCWSEDQGLLERSRARLLALAPALIVPGHGGPFGAGEL
jgi:hypothetical protein